MASSILSLNQKLELLKQIASNPNIPSPPNVVLKVLEKASASDCTIGDLGQIIQMDPGLCGKMLRVVNSAIFGLSRPVSSIQRALAVVGIKSARLLVLSITLPEMQQARKTDARAMQRYWRSSVVGAIVARELAQRLQSRDADDEMAAGLLRDLGELVLMQIFPQQAKEIEKESEEALVQTQCELEQREYGLDHAEVSAFILDQWRLPRDMTEAIRHHHHPEEGLFSTPKAEARSHLLNFATRAAQILLYPNQPLVREELYLAARNYYRMNEDDVREFLRPLGQKAADFAALLRVDMGEAADFDSVLSRATQEFVHLTISSNLDNERAQEMSRRSETEANRWRQEAVFDPLTKIFNRRFLERKLNELFEGARRGDFPLGLIFIDLDGFKPLNDRFGHAFGDLVLQQVAETLNRTARQRDYVTRYGGDEFCILSEPLEEVGLQAFATRIWQSINNLTIRQGPCEGKVGASIGAVCFNAASQWASPDSLLAAADKAMYKAKSEGKNRIVVIRSGADLENAKTFAV